MLRLDAEMQRQRELSPAEREKLERGHGRPKIQPADLDKLRVNILLYKFRFRDPITGPWTRARYAATLDEIRARYAEFEVIGQPEVREVTPPPGDSTPPENDG